MWPQIFWLITFWVRRTKTAAKNRSVTLSSSTNASSSVMSLRTKTHFCHPLFYSTQMKIQESLYYYYYYLYQGYTKFSKTSSRIFRKRENIVKSIILLSLSCWCVYITSESDASTLEGIFRSSQGWYFSSSNVGLQSGERESNTKARWRCGTLCSSKATTHVLGEGAYVK